jgi:hypothetical protein
MKLRPATWTVIAASAVVALGSLLPWITAQVTFISVSANGTNGDGKITLICGLLVVAAVLVLHLTDWVQSRILGQLIVGALLLVALGTSVYDMIHISTLHVGNALVQVTASPGIGLYLCLIGSIVAAVAFVIDVRQPTDADVVAPVPVTQTVEPPASAPAPPTTPA